MQVMRMRRGGLTVAPRFIAKFMLSIYDSLKYCHKPDTFAEINTMSDGSS